MGHGDRAVVVGQAVTVMALVDSSQFGVFLVTQRGKLLVASGGKSTVFLFSLEFMLLCLGGDEL